MSGAKARCARHGPSGGGRAARGSGGGDRSSAEQRLSRIAVAARLVAVRLYPRDLGLQRGDARAQFLDRQGIEILARQHRDGVVAAARQNIVGIHAPSVDRMARDVNKRGIYRGRTGRPR